MVEHVYRRTERARSVDEVIVATDDERIQRAVSAFGGRSVMTSPDHPSGTDRVAEVAEGSDAEIIINVQGDEPLIDPDAIDQAVAACQDSGGTAIVSLRKIVSSAKELLDPNVVKVVCDHRGHALYFSRWPIPFKASPDMTIDTLRERLEKRSFRNQSPSYKHVGLYVFPKPLLIQLTRTDPSPLERQERLEQLRALENGMPILLVSTDYEAVAVDTPEDLEHVRRLFAERGL
jgi:3-deoxy-manno-octulosonate cytidylyltransferase (CMP-KDO synthetase)